MEWIQLLNSRRFKDRTTKSADPDARSEFQRDVDRVLFSTQFRRMGDKTQVFPIPNSDFVHNRLTHSLEVASSGRSLGMLAGNFILKQKEKSLFRNSLNQKKDKFIPEDFANIVHAACLAHDIGNPPFGHSGEKAISHFFLKDSSFLDKHLTEGQVLDLKNFEGNASGFRLLTTNNYSGFPGGLRLTYATLGSYSKYPWDSSAQHNVGQKEIKSGYIKPGKFGFFQSDMESFNNVAKTLGLVKNKSIENVWCRHPLSFLMEAADTITYHIIDIEDSHKLGIISFNDAKKLLLPFWRQSKENNYDIRKLKQILGKGETIGFLRAKAINSLIFEAFEVWKDNYNAIMSGTFEIELVDKIESKNLLDGLKQKLKETAFINRNVLQIELAGYEILGGLLKEFMDLISDGKTSRSNKLKLLLPRKYIHELESKNIDHYECVLNMVDFVSGMTDSYAIDFFKKLKGIKLPEYN